MFQIYPYLHYFLVYHSEYRVLNFVISQRQNDVICINNCVNELSFSYCIEFNLYSEFPSEAENFWNNPRKFKDLLTLRQPLERT